MKSEIETLTPYVNTDVKIPRKMRDALTLHETSCCVRGVKTVSEQTVRQFLTDRYDANLAAMFSPKYLLNNPDV
jgi:hypothetical protein